MNKQMPNFVVSLLDFPPSNQSATSARNPSLYHAEKIEVQQRGEHITETYQLAALLEATVTVHHQKVKGCQVTRTHTVFHNEDTIPRSINGLSSTLVPIPTGGHLPWHHPERFRIHYCRQAWEGEGQWRQATLEELNILPVSVHGVSAAAHFGETSSWTTGRQYPMVVIEDLEKNTCWFVQLEQGALWHIEIGHYGDPFHGELYLMADNFSQRFGGRHPVEVAPGEQLESSVVAWGSCQGGFEEAVRELTAYRRHHLRRLPPEGHYPMAFNDYMNALWGNPTEERLLPLIDVAASVGAEYFCIDAGWFSSPNLPWSDGLGDWNPSNSRFGTGGLVGILNKIQQKGMKPGLWFELESVSPLAEIYATAPKDWFLQLDGRIVGGNVRRFWDYNNPNVCQYMLDKIGQMYVLGVRYIKNDYNESFSLADNPTGDPAYGVVYAANAFASFLQQLAEQFPDLVIESCSSGAMRSDYGVLRHCHVQSISDQEWYEKVPSVVIGTLAQMLPEQACCWSFPYPQLFPQVSEPDAEMKRLLEADHTQTEQTIFNMVSSLCGTPLLSGRLDLADQESLGLITEGVACYKAQRQFIQASYPVFPLGMKSIADAEGFAAVGLFDGTSMQLAVWRLDEEEDSVFLPLADYGQLVEVEQIYPANDYPSVVRQEKEGLTIALPARHSARLYRVTYQ